MSVYAASYELPLWHICDIFRGKPLVFTSLKEATEHEKDISRKEKSALIKRDKITKDTWKKHIKPSLIDTENQIVTYIKSLSQKDFTRVKLGEILAAIKIRVEAFDDAFRSEMGRRSEDAIKAGAEKPLKNLSIKSDVSASLLDDVLEEIAPIQSIYISDFTDAMQSQIRATLANGILKGESIGQVIDTLENKFEKNIKIGRSRAEKIARTEIMRAHSTAAQKQASEIRKEIPLLKRWLHNERPNMRLGHAEAEKKYMESPIDSEDFFRVRSMPKDAYEEGKYPRDILFSAKNTVNCTCDVVYLKDEKT